MDDRSFKEYNPKQEEDLYKSSVVHSDGTTVVSIGERKNSGKLKWHTFPKFLLKPLIAVGHFGATKYAAFNFLNGLSVNECLDSLDRHLEKLSDPNQSDYDMVDEDGKPGSTEHHLAHVAWNALVALYMIKTRPDLDDRYKGNKKDEDPSN